jgi:Rrf2 family protein
MLSSSKSICQSIALLGDNDNRISFRRVFECCVDNLFWVLYTKTIILVKKEVKAMKLSTRGRYATRALLDLALHQGEKPVLLKDIARRQQISVRYLEHLITPLIAGGIVRSTRGAKGGVWLIKPPEEIRLSDVIQLVEGSLAPVECVNNPDICGRSAFCVTRDLWGELKKAMNGVLEATTLQDLVERQRRKGQVGAAMYHI